MRALPVELLLRGRDPASGAVVGMEVVLGLGLAESAAHAHELVERSRLLGDAENDDPFAGQGGILVVESLQLLFREASGLSL